MPKVIITRPIDMASELKSSLEAANIDNLLFPVIDIQPLSVDVTISFIDYYVFISRNAVTHGVALLPKDSKTLAIGKGTYDALVENGFTPSVKPEKPYTSEKFLSQKNLPLQQSDHIAIIKGVGGRGVLASQLRKKVASVSTVNVYARKIAQPSDKLIKEYEKTLKKDCRAIFVNSVETLENLISMTSDDCLDALKSQLLITGSERVAEEINKNGFSQTPKLASSMSDKDMIKCLLSAK